MNKGYRQMESKEIQMGIESSEFMTLINLFLIGAKFPINVNKLVKATMQKSTCINN